LSLAFSLRAAALFARTSIQILVVVSSALQRALRNQEHPRTGGAITRIDESRLKVFSITCVVAASARIESASTVFASFDRRVARATERSTR
jgi:hypothetical protein